MTKSILIDDYPVIGIRPTIDGRRGVLDVRGSLEKQTMDMVHSATEIFTENFQYSNYKPVRVIIVEGYTVDLPEKVSDKFWKRTDYTWKCTWFTPRLTGKGSLNQHMMS